VKRKIRGELILALFFLAFFITLMLISMTYSPKARRMPLVVILPGLTLAVVIVIKETIKKVPALKRGEVTLGETGDGMSESPAAPAETKRMFIMFGWMAFLIGMIWIVGFLITIPVYTILFMKSLKESWRLSIIFGVVGFILLYGIFVFGLNMELYPGLIFQP
jgi:hypothetical protein